MKKKGLLPAIIMFVVTIIMAIVSFVLHFYEEGKFGFYTTDLIGLACLLVAGIFMIFVKLKSWGWMFVVVCGAIAAIIPILKKDWIQIASGCVIFAVGVIMLLLRNVKKEKK